MSKEMPRLRVNTDEIDLCQYFICPDHLDCERCYLNKIEDFNKIAFLVNEISKTLNIPNNPTK